MTQTPFAKLLESYTLNSKIKLNNRLVVAPFLRRYHCPDSVPSPDLASFYVDRAKSGLIVTEATMISPCGKGYTNTQGIYNSAQMKAWEKIVAKAHAAGATIFLQLWHAGRAAHSSYLNGSQPLAPSSLRISGTITWSEGLEYETPKTLSLEEIEQLTHQFAIAAENAIKVGFDGVEIHAANGYLIDQFLHYESNKRTDEYGGSSEKRTLFACEVVEKICTKIGSDRVGIRLSPAAYLKLVSHPEEDPLTFKILFSKLQFLGLAYVHESSDNDQQVIPFLDGTVSQFIRKNYSGTFIANGSFTPELALEAITNDECDLVSFGRLFVANPDLVERLANNLALRPFAD